MTIKKGIGSFNFQSSDVFEVSTTTNCHLKNFIRCISGKYEVWGIYPPITLNLKKDTRTSDHQCNESTLKFIRPSFLYIPYMPPGHNLKPLPWGLWGVIVLKDNFPDLSTALDKMAISKFWLPVFEEMMGVGGGLVALQSLSTIKKSTSPFNFQSNELFYKFMRQQMAITKFLSYAFRENTVWG